MPRAHGEIELLMDARGTWVWRCHLEATDQHNHMRSTHLQDGTFEGLLRQMQITYREFVPLEQLLVPALPKDEVADKRAELLVSTALGQSEPFNPAVRPQPRVIPVKR